ncbi:hypothetical protein [Nocardioides korecus]
MTFRDAALLTVDKLADAVECIPVVVIRRSQIRKRAHANFIFGLECGERGVTRERVEQTERRRRLTLVETDLAEARHERQNR